MSNRRLLLVLLLVTLFPSRIQGRNFSSGRPTITVENARNISLIQTFEVDVQWHRTIAFSPDGSLLAINGLNPDIELWDTATWDSRGTLKGLTDQPYYMVFSPDGTKLLVNGSYGCSYNIATGDPTVILWDLSTQEEIRRWEHLKTCGLSSYHSYGNRTYITAFSPDNQLVALVQNDGLHLYDLSNPSYDLYIPPIESGIMNSVAPHVEFSPDNQLIAYQRYGESGVGLWNVATGDLIGSFRDFYHPSFNRNGDLLLMSGGNGDFTILNIPTGEMHCSSHITVGGGHSVTSWSPDDNMFTIFDSLWDIENCTEVATIGSLPSFSPDGNLIAAIPTIGDNSFAIWNTQSGDKVIEIPVSGFAHNLVDLQFSPDGTMIATTDIYGETKIYAVP
jgi:WD40 repeat protein